MTQFDYCIIGIDNYQMGQVFHLHLTQAATHGAKPDNIVMYSHTYRMDISVICLVSTVPLEYIMLYGLRTDID